MEFDGIDATPEEIAEFREIFNLVDLDGGGSIDLEELRELMDLLGMEASEEGKLWPYKNFRFVCWSINTFVLSFYPSNFYLLLFIPQRNDQDGQWNWQQ